MTSPKDPPKAQPGPWARHRRWALPLLAVALVAVAGAAAWRLLGARDKPTDRYVIATVQRGDIEDLVTATGALQPRDYVDVGAQVSGQLKKLYVDVGDTVKEGDLVAEIDATQSAARVDANRAALLASQASLQQNQVALEKARRDAERQRRLMAEDATTQETLQNAETAVREAEATIAQNKATIEQQRASMRVEEANLRFTKLYAPMAGTVVTISAKQGQTLNAVQTAPVILRIGNLATMTVQTQVSEADVTRLGIDMPVYFTTLGGQGRQWWGKLRKIEPTPTVTNNVVLYNALFDVANPRSQLMPQMTAQVFFVAAEAKQVLTVPMAAVTMQRAGRGARAAAGAPSATTSGLGRPGTVRLIKPDGTVEQRAVRVGVSDRISAEILSGLAEGEQVIVGEKAPERRNAGDGRGNGGGNGRGGQPQRVGPPPGFGR